MTIHYTFAMEIGRQRREQLTGAPKADRRSHYLTAGRWQHRTWPWSVSSWRTRSALNARIA